MRQLRAWFIGLRAIALWTVAYMLPLLLVCIPIHLTARALDGKMTFTVASLPVTFPTVVIASVSALVSDAKVCFGILLLFPSGAISCLLQLLFASWVGFCWLLPAMHADGYLPVLTYAMVLLPHFAALAAGFVAGLQLSGS